MYNFMHEDTFDGSLMPLPTLHKALWAWIIAKARPDARAPGGGSVMLNPRLLVAYFPDQSVDAIASVIGEFCEPDPHSRSTPHEGRRLIALGRDRYAVTGYETHAGSRLARDAQRKREWRDRKRQEGSPQEPNDAPAPATPDVPHGTRTRPEPLITNTLKYTKLLETHAFVRDNLQIPNALHAQLLNLMGANTSENVAKLEAFYEHLSATRGDEAIPNIFKWTLAKFEAWVKAKMGPGPASVEDDAYARELARSSTRHESKLSQEKKNGTHDR